MDENQARERLLTERAEVLEMLRESEAEVAADRAAAAEQGDLEDPVPAVSAEGMAIASANRFRDRVAAIDRALHRLDNGTYGRSVRSGEPIPSDRLGADPAAELTIEEAQGRRLTGVSPQPPHPPQAQPSQQAQPDRQAQPDQHVQPSQAPQQTQQPQQPRREGAHASPRGRRWGRRSLRQAPGRIATGRSASGRVRPDRAGRPARP
jgi:DnaK suppressor protein